MKVTKQHKILGIVLALGGIALVSDRLFFLKSAANEAAPEPASAFAVAAPIKPAGTIALAAPITTSTSIAKRLRTVAESQDLGGSRDAFVLGSAWPAQVATAAKHVDGVNPADQFRQSHKLTGALTSGGAAHAMIDGKIVTVGENIDGYRLVSISHRSATFEPVEGEPVTLNMNERTGNATASVVP